MIIIAILLFLIGASKICILADASEIKLSSDGLPITEKQGTVLAKTLLGIDAVAEVLGGLFIMFL